nr:proton-conducting transporter membrane subunit [Nitrospiraceae bacterium]
GALRGTVYFSRAETFYCDPLSAYILMVIALLSAAAAVYSMEYMASELKSGAITPAGLRYYYFLLNLFVFTMMLVPVSNNLALLWIAIEATTLVSALLVGIYRKKQSIEAAWKYIVLCTVGITFALLGTFIIYYAGAGLASARLASGEPGTLNWTGLRLIAGRLNPATVRLAFILIMVGYGTKAGLAPVHNWLPDAHSEAPTPVSALLSGILLNCAFYGIMRFAIIARAACGQVFVQDIMAAFGLASIILAGTFMLIQHNAKRLLAYSSIEHMGIICLSFAVGGAYGFYAALLHILNHALGKPLMFFVTGRIHSGYHTVETEEVSGFLKMSPLTGVLGFAGIMALAGAPPFNIFLSEFLMVKGLAAGAHWYMMAIFLGASGFVFYGLLKDFGGMFLGKPEGGHEIRHEGNWWPASLMMTALGAGLLFLGLFIPAGLNRLITLSIKIIGPV